MRIIFSFASLPASLGFGVAPASQRSTCRRVTACRVPASELQRRARSGPDALEPGILAKALDREHGGFEQRLGLHLHAVADATTVGEAHRAHPDIHRRRIADSLFVRPMCLPSFVFTRFRISLPCACSLAGTRRNRPSMRSSRECSRSASRPSPAPADRSRKRRPRPARRKASGATRALTPAARGIHRSTRSRRPTSRRSTRRGA